MASHSLRLKPWSMSIKMAVFSVNFKASALYFTLQKNSTAVILIIFELITRFTNLSNMKVHEIEKVKFLCIS